MEWFSRRTSIAGIEIPTWLVVLGAITVLVLIYSFMQEAQIAH
jgi:type VI protein secretion system component VasF